VNLLVVPFLHVMKKVTQGMIIAQWVKHVNQEHVYQDKNVLQVAYVIYHPLQQLPPNHLLQQQLPLNKPPPQPPDQPPPQPPSSQPPLPLLDPQLPQQSHFVTSTVAETKPRQPVL
jgi:hypothetical protein